MSCAQVMYQPYAPSPYVVQPDTPQTAPTHASGSATTAAVVAAAGESRHSEGGGGGPILHHPQPSTSSITPHTPPHAHHHHHQQPQSLPQPQIQRTSEAGSNSGQVPQQGQQTPQATQQQTQGQQQPQASSSDGSGAQRSLTRPPYRAASNGSAAGDPDAPPPEKKFCSDTETPPTPATPSSSVPHAHHPHHHQASHQQHQHHHHHHHHSHHHPPHTETPGSPAQHTNQQQEVKYVSANCMVVTHYAGDTSAVVDEHFTRALSTPHYEKPHSPGKAASPMSSRNFPPSFWNSNYQIPATSRPPSLAGHLAGASPADLYDPYHGGLHSLQAPPPDPWAAYSLSSQAYGHRSVAHDVYQAAMSSVPSSSRPYHQYSSLSFQPHLARLPGVTPVASQMPMAKPDSWGARYHEAFSNPELAAAHGLETNYPGAHYPNVPGLETGVPQEGAKDLYWF